MMKKNVGGMDRVARIVLGLVGVGAGLYFQSWWGLLGLAILGTGIFKTCYLYTLLGISTCPMEKESTPPQTPPTPKT